jgi:hypothetical protein
MKNKIKSVIAAIARVFKEQGQPFDMPICEKESVVLLEAGPDDMVVLTYPGRLSIEQKDRIVQLWADWANNKTRPIVLDDGMKIVVIKRA